MKRRTKRFDVNPDKINTAAKVRNAKVVKTFRISEKIYSDFELECEKQDLSPGKVLESLIQSYLKKS